MTTLSDRGSREVLSRRTMLRGLGVTMALPWLESLRVWGDEPTGRAAASQPPVRFACLFSGNGFHSKEWWARGTGRDMKLGKVLEPLDPFKEKLLFIRGLFNAEALKGNIHSSQTGNLLSGAPLAAGGAIRSGTSIDQVLAQKIGGQTKVPSLVLACEPSMASVHKNYSMLYSSHISWTSPTSPAPLELYPALAFDRLFKDDFHKTDKSVLDAVLDDASSLRGRISHADQLKLDEYLTSVRDVEARIERAGKDQQLQGWRPTLSKPNIPRPPDGVPQDIAEHMRLMCDILVLAFQTDTTRFCTLKLNNDHSSLRFPNLGVDYMIHHLALAHRFGRLAQGQSFLRQPARLPRSQAGRHPGRRAHGARSFDHHVLFEHADRWARCLPVAGRDPGSRRGPARQRPHARLSGQAEPQDVQPVSLAHGQVWCTIARVRRLAGAPHGGLKPPESSRGLSHASFLRPLLARRNRCFAKRSSAPGRRRFRRAGAGLAARERTSTRREHRAIPRPVRRPTSRPGPRESFICSCTAVPATWKRLTPSPTSSALSGQPLPPSFGHVSTRRQVAANPLLGNKANLSPARSEWPADFGLSSPHRRLRR